MVIVLARDTALARTAVSMGLSADIELDIAFVAQAIRRAATIICPCPRGALERAVVSSLRAIARDEDGLQEAVAEALDGLLAFGDVLEMTAPGLATSDRPRFQIRPAPPYFVRINSRELAILGVAGDDISPLAGLDGSHLVHRGCIRIAPTAGEESLSEYIEELGIPELSLETWLRIPRPEQIANYVKTWKERLAKHTESGEIEGLTILDHDKPVTFYKGRWTKPSNQNGTYIARRPQKYGSEIWCLVHLQTGAPTHLLDLNSPGDRFRACDVAWRIQLAFDACADHRQQYRAEVANDMVVLSFFSPIPSWAERRLLVSGPKIAHPRCLFAFTISTGELDRTRRFLTEELWLAETEGNLD